MSAPDAPAPSDERSTPHTPTDEHPAQAGEVHLVYQIEGKPHEVPIFELSRTLEALGNVIQEGDRVVSRDSHEVVVQVRPFEEGSFIMDLVLSVQNNPAVLFFLTHPEAIERIKKVLEYLGLIKSTGELLTSLREVVEHLRNGKPAKVEPAGPDVFNYYNQEGQVLPVNLPVHNLVNNGTIQQFFFPAVAALRRLPELTRLCLPKVTH